MKLQDKLNNPLLEEETQEQSQSLLDIPKPEEVPAEFEAEEGGQSVEPEPTTPEAEESKQLIKDGLDDANNDVTADDSFEQAFHVVPKNAPPVDRKKFQDRISELREMYQKSKKSEEKKQFQTIIAQSLVKLVGSAVAYKQGVPLGKLEFFTPDWEARIKTLNTELDRDIGLVEKDEASATADQKILQGRFDKEAEGKQKGLRDKLTRQDTLDKEDRDRTYQKGRDAVTDNNTSIQQGHASKTLAETIKNNQANVDYKDKTFVEGQRQFGLTHTLNNKNADTTRLKAENARKAAEAKALKAGDKLTPRQLERSKSAGKNDAKFEEEFKAGRVAYQENQLTLNKAKRILERPGEIGGKVNALFADWSIHKDARNVKDLIEKVVQGTLRQTIGAQFAAKEAEQLFARTYNPALSDEENLFRLNLLIKGAEARHKLDTARYEYIQKNNGGEGWDDTELYKETILELNELGKEANFREIQQLKIVANSKGDKSKEAQDQLKEMGIDFSKSTKSSQIDPSTAKQEELDAYMKEHNL